MTESTRTRIQRVALELFTEQGYEKTSLREVAERLGVTKAALYYHFKSKDEIVSSLVEDRLTGFDELIKEAEGLPPTAATRRLIIERYADSFAESGQPSIMRFFEQNQTVVKSLSVGRDMRTRMMRIAALIARPDESPEGQLRAALAIFAVHGSHFAVGSKELTPEERRALSLKIANELLDKIQA